GVGRLYGGRPAGGLLDGWLVDEEDSGAVVPEVTVRAVPLRMTDEAATAAMVRAAVELT
ncbi:2-phospho-L-lactate transferase, partial [Micromonospora orduensis]